MTIFLATLLLQSSAPMGRGCISFFDVFSNPRYDLYPIVIMQSRYGGAYEGGRWIAIGCFESMEKSGLSDYVSGDDDDASAFWSSEAATRIGRGPNPNSAVVDLCTRNGFDPNELIRTYLD